MQRGKYHKNQTHQQNNTKKNHVKLQMKQPKQEVQYLKNNSDQVIIKLRQTYHHSIKIMT